MLDASIIRYHFRFMKNRIYSMIGLTLCFLRKLLMFSCGVAVLAQSSFAQTTELQGKTASGAYYKIAVPKNWQTTSGLVIWNHGYQGYTQTEPEPNPSLGPLESTLLQQGYAIAASSFSQTGWVLFNSHIDNQELYEIFVERYGVPEKLYIQGGSMGGSVSLRDLEAGRIPEADGALLMCGVTSGAENWYNAYDLRMIYEAVCNQVSGGELPTKDWYQKPQAITGELEFLQSLSSCVGIFPDQVPPALADFARSSAQTRRLDRILSVSGVSKEFLLLDLGYAVFEIPNLVNDSQKLAGNKPFSNAGIDYGDEEINLKVRRDAALPSARQKLLNNYTPSGKIGSTKVVSIHTSGDGLVKVENQTALANLLPVSQLSSAVVVEEQPSHCGFNENEVISAWNSLTAWVEGSAQPQAAQLQQRCLAEGGNNELCRYEPNFETSGQVVGFPRNQSAAVLGNNEFNDMSSQLAVSSVKVMGDSENYTLTLVPASNSATTFAVNSISSTAAPDSWQHQAQFFPADALLYVPQLKIVPSAPAAERYDLYMTLEGGNSGTQFKLLEFERADP